MMLPRIITCRENPKSDCYNTAVANHSSRDEREQAAVVGESVQEQAGSSTILASEKPPLLVSYSEAQNIEKSTHDLKKDQIASINAQINFLKRDYYEETDLIQLLESYLHKYEQASDLRPFHEWLANLIVEQQQILTSKQQDDSAAYDLKIEQYILKLLLSDRQILDAVLFSSISLEKVHAYHQIRADYLASKSAFENGKIYSELQTQHATAIKKYNAAEAEFSESKKAYYRAIEENSSYEVFTQSEIHDLCKKSIEKKNAFKSCQANLISTYGSLEEAKSLKEQYSKAGSAMEMSSYYWNQKASILEQILNQSLGEQKTDYCRTLATIFDLLAQDHLALATAVIEKNQIAIDHLHERISLAKQAGSISAYQLSIFNRMTYGTADDNLIKSLPLLQDAGHCFLSAYHFLKDQNRPLSQTLSDRGFNLLNTTLVFQIAPIPQEQRAYYPRDFVDAIDHARHHAEQALQTTVNETRSYHAKIADFLYERILTMNHLIEATHLQSTILPTSPSFHLLEKVISIFYDASAYFQKLSELPGDQLDSSEGKSIIEVALQLKTKATRMLFQQKALLNPKSVTDQAPQNQNLLFESKSSIFH